MHLNNVEIEDTFAEAFTGYYSRILITAINRKWAEIAALEATGYATSMIGCSAEAGIESFAKPEKTPDGRPGFVIQIWTSKKKIKDELLNRIGQCILTAPTAAVWNFCNGEKLDIGYKMKYFGDGYEEIKNIHGREVVIIPIMMGEFWIEKEICFANGVAGGNFLILAENQSSALAAGESAIKAIEEVGGVITPFPGGICASGSKVSSNRYKFMRATTNEEYCPTLVNKAKTTKVRNIGAVAEIVINGISEEKVREAMASGIRAAVHAAGVRKISAGNYDGKLGNVKIYLNQLF